MGRKGFVVFVLKLKLRSRLRRRRLNIVKFLRIFCIILFLCLDLKGSGEMLCKWLILLCLVEVGILWL